MITLSDFIGELIYDISKARSYADCNCAALSEQYFADPFIKNLPVPHYTIDEAEIDVPVMVVGIKTSNSLAQAKKDAIVDVVKKKVPLLLLRSYKFNYVRNKEAQREKENEDRLIKSQVNSELDKKDGDARSEEKIKISSELLNKFSRSSTEVGKLMTTYIQQYLNNYNYEIFKLLDLSEEFSRSLARCITDDLENYSAEEAAFSGEENINGCARYVGNLMFFEFKKIMSKDGGVEVDVTSSGMNEYSQKDYLMNIKLKIREQDLSLLVEDKNGKEKRYLSII